MRKREGLTRHDHPEWSAAESKEPAMNYWAMPRDSSTEPVLSGVEGLGMTTL